ncbi:peptidase domain-containing ABC transporter [Chromobacterium paludis]|uniref:Cyclolysin secretion/processing ATP-binding protein CyaB n=1 Tax=Chromobacterium paludis TaxID=2605945 RepID=A0A5C1DMP8_9NEIS|nr:peptidase domain-containing ABC transporter [Chromobacterium paludis]QEL57357.1 peptidase domain-containing ABC transporter [Chromobacterium paludis]
MSLQHPGLHFFNRRRLPLLLQTEAAECGLACLAMIASYWGHHIDLTNMRRRFAVSRKGTTLKSLIGMAQGLGLQTRPLKLDMPFLPQLKLPCALHWDMNHFVVLKRVTAKHIVIHDPAVGERKLSLEEAAKHFTGVALELVPGHEFTPMEERQHVSLLALMGRVDGLGRGVSQLLLLGLALQVCALAAPFYLQWVVDEALLAADRNLITVLGIGFLLLVLLQSAIEAVRAWATTALATSLNFQWFGNAFAHLMKLPLAWFEKRHLGDIVSRFGAIQTIQRSLTSQFVEGAIDGLLALATLGVMLVYNAKLSVVSLIAVALYAMLRWAIFRGLREATAEQIVHAARQNTHFIESARGAQSIRLFGRQESRRILWMNMLADQFNADLSIARLTISFQTANSLLFNAERVIVVWLAALAVLDHQFSVGMLIAFLSYKDQFSQRISSLIDKLFELRMLRLHGERLADILMAAPEPEYSDVEIDPEQVQPAIEIRNACFRYSDGEPYVLQNLNLIVPAGQCLAITGASGCGKTTLLKLMLGLLEPSEGEVLIGGIPLKQLGLANYRQMLGTVMQDDQLFAGSIGDNICFFDPQPDVRRIYQCAKLAAIHDEIIAMPMAYNTLCGDIGSGLSGGQKQRILLARALYKQPKLLVLDEATSHLDVWNEKLVNAAVRDIAMTRLLVAHRPETIAMAERVVVLEQGKIVQDTVNDDVDVQGGDAANGQAPMPASDPA